MDPYLEGSLWTSVHTQLSVEIARHLTPKLRPKYIALTTERFVLDESESVAIAPATVFPDVGVTEAGQSATCEPSTAVIKPPIRLRTVVPESVPHVNVEIRDAANRELVTAIEILSPTNKRGRGRREYLAKRRRLLLSTAHLIEIDLLRAGQRLPMEQSLPPARYYVFVGRCECRPLVDVWPIQLSDPLPVIPVPLLPGDADVQLDLQTVLSQVYDLAGLDLAVDYSRAPDAALTEDEFAWACEQLRAARKRT
jgi:hypothetical protein